MGNVISSEGLAPSSAHYCNAGKSESGDSHVLRTPPHPQSPLPPPPVSPCQHLPEHLLNCFDTFSCSLILDLDIMRITSRTSTVSASLPSPASKLFFPSRRGPGNSSPGIRGWTRGFTPMTPSWFADLSQISSLPRSPETEETWPAVLFLFWLHSQLIWISTAIFSTNCLFWALSGIIMYSSSWIIKVTFLPFCLITTFSF